MGLLKHFVLPVFLVFHAYMAFSVIGGSFVDIAAINTNPKSSAQSLSLLDRHLIAIIGTFHIAFAINNAVGIIMENAHYRGLVCLLELVVSALTTYDTIVLGNHGTSLTISTQSSVLLACTALSSIGLLVHSMEPGVFTKDKSKIPAKTA
jgi:exosortase/archaeosortase